MNARSNRCEPPGEEERDLERNRTPVTFAPVLRLAGFLALSGTGGLAAAGLGLPVPYLLGTALVSALLGVSGIAPTRLPEPLSVLARVAVGIMIGASIEIDLLRRLPEFGMAAILVPVQITLSLVVGNACLRCITRMTSSERLLGAIPGGFSSVVLSVDALGKDIRRISLYHAIRILVTVTTVPLLLTWGLSLNLPEAQGTGADLADIGLPGVGSFLLLGVAGWVLVRRFTLPAGPVLLPLALAVAAEASIGLPDAPREAVSAVQIVMGALIGFRFAEGGLKGVRNTLWTGVLLTILLLIVTLVPVVVIHLAADMPLGTAILAFAPGGLPEISVLALSLAQDPALVVAVHAWRIIVVLLMLPFLLRWMERRGGEAP